MTATITTAKTNTPRTTRTVPTLALAAALVALPVSMLAQSAMQTSVGVTGTANDLGATTQLRGAREAMRMVPAQAMLIQDVDANKMQAGAEFKAKLLDTIHLTNGDELHSGTVLVGRISTDARESDGRPTLAVRFTDADLKDGQTVPIKATIVEAMQLNSNVPFPADQLYPTGTPDSWNDGTLAVDDIGVLSNVNMYSRIASRDSAVFVSSKKDVKLPAGMVIGLAIAPRPAQQS